ncbi:hypothetical protein AC731_004335 [Thauera humireducens]|uniref:Uncharacterized protein n=1 Tax=Thauera humireducens TaxID=1134435 RepID=A0A127K2P1_9RHOO|nr:hypothetical protein AC731_004335 [Thauera humireducens]
MLRGYVVALLQQCIHPRLAARNVGFSAGNDVDFGRVQALRAPLGFNEKPSPRKNAFRMVDVGGLVLDAVAKHRKVLMRGSAGGDDHKGLG